ncbi:sulfotransferase family 2 domain-containing protein [Paraneptunicella aestuarii]|uniref:sulfotransferase family 2 domain-containing protein n=1 Tax=Paraneptunicella aestuarii TaxID=2831148 RepID=UPI001E435483|nr:sulfotransferase family 2 domain-containing protein [Paraneptunicella aestuarii]
MLRKYGEAFCKTTLVFQEESLGNIYDILRSKDHDKIATVNQAKLVTGHYPYGIHSMLEGESRYFTLLRDPVDRIRSYYVYSLHNEGSKIGLYLKQNKISLEQFVQLERKDIEKSGVHELNYVLEDGQAKIIAGDDILIGDNYGQELRSKAEDNIARDFDFVGVTELFDESFIEICKLLGFGAFNLYITHNKAVTSVDVSDNVRRIVLERNQIDQQMHRQRLDAMRANSGTFMDKLAQSYLKCGTSLVDFYVKMRT